MIRIERKNKIFLSWIDYSVLSNLNFLNLKLEEFRKILIILFVVWKVRIYVKVSGKISLI